MIPAIKNMTTDKKIALVEELWEDIEKERAKPLSDSQMNHIRKRIEEYRINGNQGTTWEEVKGRYSKH